MTVNELLVLMKMLRQRIAQLQSLQLKCAGEETFYGQQEKTVKPKYDVKKVDAKIVSLQNFLFGADAKIKQSNATTRVDIDVDVKNLLEPLV